MLYHSGSAELQTCSVPVVHNCPDMPPIHCPVSLVPLPASMLLPPYRWCPVPIFLSFPPLFLLGLFSLTNVSLDVTKTSQLYSFLTLRQHTHYATDTVNSPDTVIRISIFHYASSQSVNKWPGPAINHRFGDNDMTSWSQTGDFTTTPRDTETETTVTTRKCTCTRNCHQHGYVKHACACTHAHTCHVRRLNNDCYCHCTA